MKPGLILEVLNGDGIINSKNIGVYKGDKPNLVKFKATPWGKGQQYYLCGITWHEAGDRSTGKAIAGGIVGGVVAGPLGAAAGALMGGKKVDTSSVIITIDTDAGNANIMLRCTSKEFQQLSKFLR